jgi:transcriptional regulator GlxA family with amidase domain
MTRTVGFLVFPGFNILDLSGPLAAFDTASRDLTPPPYRLQVISEQGGAVDSSAGLPVLTQPFRSDAPLDTLVVAGGRGVPKALESARLLAFIREAATARRVASVCTGAFLLAAAGLLDGRRATTHWLQAAALQRLHPQVRVEMDRIFIQDGPVWSSAGVTAGIDLTLALIEEDLGVDAARTVARTLVVYHRRPGGQSQFSALLDLAPATDRIQAALSFARENLQQPLPVDRLAEAACLSPRQFGRAFLAETGQTPAKAVERLRAEAARPRVEDGAEPIEVIARDVGFADPERMRRAFLRCFGQPPQAMRRGQRTGAPAMHPKVQVG